ncbi:MAG: PHP domain-containing protein [Actinomycetota bacterium]
MKRGYDLHTHSNQSDGALPPAEVVRRAHTAGLAGIALTDHDTTAGYEEAKTTGDDLGVDVFLGCELSAQLDGSSVHVLAYFVDPDHARWVEELQWIRDDREVRANAIVDKLRATGIDITMEMVKAAAGGDSIGRPHIATAMVQAGVISRTPEAFTPEWIADGGACYVGKRVLDPVASVELIREAGGAAVLAHPVWLDLHGLDGDAVIEACAEAGLAGLEVYHPEHDDEASARFANIANELGLVATSASDFHGNQHGGMIGQHRTQRSIVDELRRRAEVGRIDG